MAIPGKKTVVLLSIFAVAIAAVAVGLIAFANRPPVRILLAVSADAVSRKAVGEALVAYNAQSKRYAAFLATEKDSKADVLLGPHQEEAVAWRSVGWQLWARLETLGTIEGKLKRSLIRYLREGNLDLVAFEKMLYDIRDQKVAPILVPEAPESIRWAWTRYLEKLGGETDLYKKWTDDRILVTVPDLRSLVDGIVKGRGAFILAGMDAGGWLERSTENHPDNFPLPTMTAAKASWIIGKTESFAIAKDSKSRAGAIDLIVYLTSKDRADQFAKILRGQFYSWSVKPAKTALPSVNRPVELFDPDAPR